MNQKQRIEQQLDDVYDRLPILWGEHCRVARELGISVYVLYRRLKQLCEEGVCRHVARGDWHEEGEDV